MKLYKCDNCGETTKTVVIELSGITRLGAILLPNHRKEYHFCKDSCLEQWLLQNFIRAEALDQSKGKI